MDLQDIRLMVWKANRVAQNSEEKDKEIINVKDKMLFHTHAYQMIYTCTFIHMCM